MVAPDITVRVLVNSRVALIIRESELIFLGIN